MDRRTLIARLGAGALGVGTLGIGGWLASGRSPTYHVELDMRTFEYVLTMRTASPRSEDSAVTGSDDDSDESVIGLTELDEETRTIIERAAARRQLGLTDPHDALRETVDSIEYVQIDDSLYVPRLQSLATAPVEIDATLRDDRIAPGSPARIDLTVTNIDDKSWGVFSGAPGPFGILRASRAPRGVIEDKDDALLLWSPAYEASTHVQTIGGLIVGANDIGIVTDLESGEEATEEYQLRRREFGLRPGSFVVEDSVSIERYDEETDEIESAASPFELWIDVQ